MRDKNEANVFITTFYKLTSEGTELRKFRQLIILKPWLGIEGAKLKIVKANRIMTKMDITPSKS